MLECTAGGYYKAHCWSDHTMNMGGIKVFLYVLYHSTFLFVLLLFYYNRVQFESRWHNGINRISLSFILLIILTRIFISSSCSMAFDSVLDIGMSYKIQFRNDFHFNWVVLSFSFNYARYRSFQREFFLCLVNDWYFTEKCDWDWTCLQ